MLDDSQSELIGRVIGRDYRVEARLGRGGMGAVYRVTQLSTGRLAALKVIHPHLVDADMRARFRQESAALGRLNHPHVVTVYTYGQEEEREDGLVYLAMELVKGRSMQDLLEADAPLDVPRALTLATQICEALAFAHGERIVHRDLKPRNVMVTQVVGREVVKLLDFGLAKVLDDHFIETMSGQIMGSPPYMAPEQWEERPEIDGRADIYAFGCMLYVMLVGALPFQAETTLGYMKAHLGSRPRSPTSLRPDLAGYPEVLATLERCLARDREERWSDSATLLDRLRELELRLKKEALASRPPQPAPVTPTPSAWSEHDFETEPPSAKGVALAETITSPPPARMDEGEGDDPLRRRVWLPWVAAAGVLAAGVWIATAMGRGGPIAPEDAQLPLERTMRVEPDAHARPAAAEDVAVATVAEPEPVTAEVVAAVVTEVGAGVAEARAPAEVSVVRKPARAVVEVNGEVLEGGTLSVAPGAELTLSARARGHKALERTLTWEDARALPEGTLVIELERKSTRPRPPKEDPEAQPETPKGPGLKLDVVPEPK